MSNFMGPMAPPQAAPQTPPQMDVKSSPSQRAQFKNFMRGMSMPQLLPNIGMGVPPEQTSFAPMPQNPMLDVDIFSAPPMMMADGGVVGGLNDLQQMSSQMVEALNTVVYGGSPSGGGFGGGMGSSMPMRPTVGMIPPPISDPSFVDRGGVPNATLSPRLPASPVQAQPFTGTGNTSLKSLFDVEAYHRQPEPPYSLIAETPRPLASGSTTSVDDIFNISQFPALGIGQYIQGLAMGGPVGGGADAGQMAADAFSGKPDGEKGGPSGVVSDPSGPMPGPGGMADALSDILNAAPVPEPAPNYNLPQQDIMDSLNVPTPVQDVVNVATQGISVPGPLGIGSVNIAPDLSGLLSGDIGLGATYAVNFYNGGEVDGRERGIAAGAMGGAGPAADPDNIGAGAGADSGAGADKNDGGGYTADQQKAINMVNESIAKAIAPDPFDRPFGFETPPSQIPDGDSGDNLNDPNIFGEEGGVDVVQDAFGGDAKAAEAFIDKVMRVPTTLQKTPSLLGYGLGHTILSPESFTDAISDFVEKGGQYNPETGNLERAQGKGKMSMNAFGLTTYSGPTSDDPFANVGISSEPEDRILGQLAADEVDPCPPGYELKDGTCVPVAPNQIGDVVTPPTTTPPPPAPSVLVPSTRPLVGPLQGPVSYRQPVGYNQSAILTPEYFQSLLRPTGMQAGGEVLDKAAGQFLEAIRAA